MRAGVLSVHGSEELRAAVAAFKAADKELRRDLNRRTRETLGPEWVKALSAEAVHLGAPGSWVLLKGARVAGGNPPALFAANSKRRVKPTRLIPTEHWAAYEFGAPGKASRVKTYKRRNRSGSGTHEVTRDVWAQLPTKNKSGYAIYPAVKDILPRLAALWVQTVVRTYLDAAEGK